MNCTPLNGCYEIHSVGDPGFLRQILNACAGIFAAGDFASACAASMLLGVLAALFRGLYSGGRVEIGAVFTAMLLYLLLIVPRVTVLVEDIYTGETHVTDNVPVGVAAPGHFISALGFRLAEMIDQSFGGATGEHGITRRPFLESLEILGRLREREYHDSLWTLLGKEAGGADVRSSVGSFWRDCMMVKYQFLPGSSAGEDAERSLSTILGDFPSRVYGTVSYGASGAEETDCHEAGIRIGSWMKKITPDLVNRAGAGTVSPASGVTPYQQISSSLEMLGASAVTAADMVRASLLLPLFRRAAADYYHSQHDFAAGAMVEQAVLQRNIQWAAEQSVFMTTVRPLASFFEGFVYAISPFAAVLICIGGFGIGTAARYFQTLIWIQLWMPILCVINLYAASGLRSEAGRLALNGRSWDSAASLEGLHSSLENWTATAGMLAASTPLIALFIVTAGSYTFTAVAGRMAGGDHVDERILAPDLVSQPPLLTNEQGTMVNTATGVALKSRAPQLPAISFTSSDTGALTSTMQKGVAETLAASRDLNESWLDAVGTSQGLERARSVQEAVSSSGSSVLTSMWQESLEHARRTGADATDIFASAFSRLTGTSVTSSRGTREGASLTASAGGSLAAGGQGSARASASLTGGTTLESSAESRSAGNAAESADERSSVSASRSLAQELGSRIASSHAGTDSSSLSVALSRGIVDSSRSGAASRQEHSSVMSRGRRFSRSLSSSIQYQEASSRAAGSAWSRSADLKSFAYDARRSSPELLDTLARSLMASPNGAGAVTRHAADFSRRFGITDPVTAGDMAVLQAAHEGTEEQRASVLALWTSLNGGAGVTSLGAGEFGSLEAPQDLPAGSGTAGSSETGYEEASAAFSTAWESAGAALGDSGAGGDVTAGGERIRGLLRGQGASLADASIREALSSRITAVTDASGHSTAYLNGRAFDLRSLERESGGLLGSAAGALREVSGSPDSSWVTPSGDDRGCKRRLMGDLPGDIQQLIMSDRQIPTSGRDILRDPVLGRYARENGFAAAGGAGMRRMEDRARLLAAMQQDFHGGSLLNFALSSAAAGRVVMLDRTAASPAAGGRQ